MNDLMIGEVVVFNNIDHEVYARHTYEDKTGEYVTYDLSPIGISDTSLLQGIVAHHPLLNRKEPR